MEVSSKASLNAGAAAQTAVSSRQAGSARPLARTPGGRKFNGIAVAAAALALVVGTVLGAAVMRQRYKAQEAVVAVNGNVIDKEDFYRQLEAQMGDVVIRRMVGEEIYFQFARKLGRAPTDAMVAQRLREMMQQPGMAAKLAASHLAPTDIRRQVRSQLAREAVLTRDVPVSDADVQRFYNENADPKNQKALFYTPEIARIAVIITPTKDQAEQALRALQNEVPFENVASIYSRDSTRVTGGELPPILRGRTTSAKFPELERAIFSMKIGELIGPLFVNGGWWIIRCLDKQPEFRQTLDQVKEQCMLGAALQKLSSADATKIERQFVDFQKHAIVQAFWARYAKSVELK